MNRVPVPKKVFRATVAAVLILLALSAGTATAQQLQKALHRGREVAAGEVLVKFRAAPGLAPTRDEIRGFADTDRDEDVGRLGVRRLHSKSLDVAGQLAALAQRAIVSTRASAFEQDGHRLGLAARNPYNCVSSGC